MTDADTKDVRTPREHVTPSSRDPITHWLDVFTSLLAVSSKQRLRIRDELEDHLRMRVEDLMILGMPEPEAIQQAVKELGETAELAQLFQEASTRTSHTRRKTIMQSILFAAAGMGLTVGALNLAPAPTVTAPSPAVSSLSVQDLESQSPAPFGLVRDLEPGTIGDAFREIAEQNDAKLFVHWASLENVGAASEDTELPAIPAGGLSMAKALQFINSALSNEDADRIDVRFADGLMEFATIQFFDSHEIVMLEYDVSVLVPTEMVMEYTIEGQNLRKSIMAIIAPNIWDEDDGLGAIAITGSHLSVRAPQRIQVQVEAYIERLKNAMQEQMRERERLLRSKEEERKAKIFGSEEEQNALRLRTIEKLKQRRDSMATQSEFFRGKLEVASKRVWEARYLAEELEGRYRDAHEAQNRDQLRYELVELKVRLEVEELNSKMYRGRFSNFQAELEQVEQRIASERH